ncbi:unnamed protein product, partial [Scytosiphon promiscuus]
NVALHAQARASKEMVVGSAVTMAGVRQALLTRDERKNGGAFMRDKEDGGGGFADVKTENVTVFYPFDYGGLHDRSWDLVIIEGWFGMINAFIHEVRAISHPRPVTILFYCLDPQYPGLSRVAALDVEGFLTNSESTRRFLVSAAPTAFVPLAADTEAFPFHPIPPCPSGAVEGTATRRCPSEDDCRVEDVFGGGGNASRYGRVVYVGAAELIEYKEMLPRMLREAAPYGLDIYGSGWRNYPEFSGYWRGVLPQEDLAFVYGTALAVIGVTTDAQRESGKINNRVYEVLSVGAPLVSDYFLALEAIFGDSIFYARSPGDVARHIETILHSCRAPGQNRAEADERRRRRAIIENSHTWSQRSEDILAFAESLPGPLAIARVPDSDASGKRGRSGPSVARCTRQGGCLSIAIVVDHDLDGDITFLSTFVPAVDLLGSAYRITWWMTPTSWDGDYGDNRTTTRPQEEEPARHRAGGATFGKRRHMQLPRDSGCLEKYDAVWAAGQWGGTADRIVRTLSRRMGTVSTRRATTPRLTAQLTGLVLWGFLCTPSTNSPGDQEGDRPGSGASDREESCPDFAGQAGLRWYDVVYCQTGWDHAFLTRQAFEGEVSSNLQQAWGFGTALKTRSDGIYRSGDEMAVSSTQQLDVLVVGTDSQLPDMLGYLKVPGVRHIALAVIASTTGAIEANSVLRRILGAAGVDLGAHLDNLSQRFPLHVDGSRDGSSSTAPAIELLLVRHAGDADALMRLVSGAANVVIMAGGQLGTWATLVTTSGARRGGWRDQRAQADPKFILGNARNRRDDGSRIRDMIEKQLGGWDSNYYSRRLIAGMTRALCLGRGNSRISLVRPASGDSVRVAGATGASVTVEVSVNEFDVGRDGQWCITVQGRAVLCVLQNEFTVDLLISSSVSEAEWEDKLTAVESSVEERANGQDYSGEHDAPETFMAKRGFIRLEIAAELRSNMYLDILRRSQPFFLFVDPSAGQVLADAADIRVHDHEAPLVGWEETVTRGKTDGTGSAGRNTLQTSIDARDFLKRGEVVALDATRVHDRVS